MSNRGWGFVRGSLVWDKYYIYAASADSAGRFRIAYHVGLSAHVIAKKSSYQTLDEWFESNIAIVLRLKKQTP